MGDTTQFHYLCLVLVCVHCTCRAILAMWRLELGNTMALPLPVHRMPGKVQQQWLTLI